MSETAPIDDWTRAAFAALADWGTARGATWGAAGGSGLVMRLQAGDGDPVLLHAEDQTLTVHIGLWEQVFPDEEGAAADPVEAAGQAMALAEDWLEGRLTIAVFLDAADRWCGALVLDPDNTERQLADAVEALADLKPQRCELRRPRKADWRVRAIRDGNLQPD